MKSPWTRSSSHNQKPPEGRSIRIGPLTSKGHPPSKVSLYKSHIRLLQEAVYKPNRQIESPLQGFSIWSIWNESLFTQEQYKPPMGSNGQGRTSVGMIELQHLKLQKPFIGEP